MLPPDHNCYCEPFCGAAWVLFSKPPSKAEVINDADGELVSFWRVIQNHLDPFIEQFKYAVCSRQIFKWMQMTRPETLTDIQRAVRFYYLQRLAFGGKVAGKSYGVNYDSNPNLNINSVAESLLEVHWRLATVNIEHLDAFECIKRYDRPGTVFFIDPPYWGCEKDYNVAFNRFEELADLLSGLVGRFILSLGDCEDVRRIFRRFKSTEVTLKYSVCTDSASRAKVRRELLFRNFNLTK